MPTQTAVQVYGAAVDAAMLWQCNKISNAPIPYRTSHRFRFERSLISQLVSMQCKVERDPAQRARMVRGGGAAHGAQRLWYEGALKVLRSNV